MPSHSTSLDISKVIQPTDTLGALFNLLLVHSNQPKHHHIQSIRLGGISMKELLSIPASDHHGLKEEISPAALHGHGRSLFRVGLLEKNSRTRGVGTVKSHALQAQFGSAAAAPRGQQNRRRRT